MTEHAPRFDPQWYLLAYPDVAAAGFNAQDHYERFGRREGRLPHSIRGTESERDLWSGFAAEGQPLLNAQTIGSAGPDRDMACWWLARWHGAAGRWSEADRLCRQLLSPEHPMAMQIGIGATLLAVEAASRCADATRASALLDAGQAAGLPPVEATLMRGNLAQDGAAALDRIWQKASLRGVRLKGQASAPLDNLIARRRWRPRLPHPPRPLVSIILPAYNAEATLPTSLKSLLQQSWRELEIIVVDDGSRDATSTVAYDFASRDARICVINSPANEGAYAARNRGLAAAKGDFITLQDADDWAHPQKIATQIAPLLEEPDLMGSLSHWVRCTPGLYFTRWRMEPEGLVHRNVSSLMLRRAAVERLGFWDRVRVSADTEYYYRMIAAFGGAALREVLPGLPLSLGRTGDASLTGSAQTHLSSQVGGLRAAYLQAATRWHGRAATAETEVTPDPLYLPQFPDRRPFAVPPAIGLGEPQAALQPDDEIRESPMFDADWYLKVYRDVRHAGVDPALHYLQSGALQGRDPSPRFSSSGYRLAYLQDDSETNPLLHWQRHGNAAGLDPLPRFAGKLPGAADVVIFGHQAGAQLFGAERSFLDILDRLISAGQCPLIVMPQILNETYLTALRARSIAVQILPYRWRRAGRETDPDTTSALAALLAELRPKAVHVNTLVLEAPLTAARTARIPVTLHVRERPDQDAAICEALGADAPTIRSWLLAEVDHFVANSAGVAAWLAAPERTQVVANRVDPALFELPPPHGAPLRVAMISSNIAKKGIADFVAMAGHLADMGLSISCLLIGPQSDDLRMLSPLPDNVQTPGYAVDAGAALAQADIVVNLSHFAESFGRTVLEAMAAARPVVCYARGHLTQLVEDGASGYLVPPDAPLAAAEAVARLARDPALRAKIGAQARARARDLIGGTMEEEQDI